MNRKPEIKNRRTYLASTLLLIAFSAMASILEAASLNLLDTPLYLSTSVDPNVVLTFDDSGSMAWGFLPDAAGWGDGSTTYPWDISGRPRFCAHNVNRIYYDPTITYNPPINSTGAPLNATATSFTAAYFNGFNTGGSPTVNLSTSFAPKVDTSPGGNTNNLYYTPACGVTSTGTSAFYFLYDTTLAGCSPASTDNDACYRMVTVSATSGPGGTDERQNFANWYSYYSTRNLMAKSSAGLAFSKFGTNVRVAGIHLNSTGASTGSGATIFPNTISAGAMQQFSSANRATFYSKLYDSPASNWTPTRETVKAVGDYFTTADPYRDVSGNSTSTERSCRQNFQVIMTDGYWNGSGSAGTYVSTDADSGAITALPDGTAYGVVHPYNDYYKNPSTAATPQTWAGTLADATFYYWATDLRPSTNNVPTHYADTSGTAAQNYWNPLNDPANWQHLVTFTIGLGIDGTLTSADYSALKNGTANANGTTGWPQPCIGCGPENVDDLWHAALDSRGQYFSAGNPLQLSGAFNTIVQNVVARISSASAVALNSATLTSNNYVYQARFSSGNWSGQLLAYAISPTTGTISATPTWDAGIVLNGQNYTSGRSIITYKPSSNAGIPFRWPANPGAPTASELDVSQSTALNLNPNTGLADTQGSARLDYIRGDASNEGTGNGYRSRSRTCGAIACPASTNTGWLGDTIDSAPIYVGAPPFGYLDTMETLPYSAFRSTYANREPIVYVGANDGMVHGFDTITGTEKIAYVPSSVYGNLSQLTASAYSHKYFVDGNPVPGDVFINNAWHTILVGGLRKGGQGIYALDITNPSNFSEPNASTLALWEFTDKNDPDLGYTFSEPVIAKMHNGQWAVILSNGYNNTQADGAASTTGHAVLYILFIQNGIGGWTSTGYVKIDTGAGTAATPNGLAAPAAVDVDGDNVVDYIYAGDLQGNMWKFDVTSATASAWNNAANRSVVYVAKDALNNLQPITTRPQIGRMPTGQPGYMVYFGTGRYMDAADTSTATSSGTQTFYGIWDSGPVNNPTRSNLLQQTVISTQTVLGADYRVISSNPMTWKTTASSTGYIGWYLDLPTLGERSVTDPVLRDGRIIFTTLIPSSDPCTAGGDGWLMELDATSGGRLDTTPFDVNSDGTFNTNDNLCISNCSSASGKVTVPAGGQKFTGIPSSPAILAGGNPSANPGCTGAKCQEQKLMSNSDATIKSVAENPANCNYCRASWRQLR